MSESIKDEAAETAESPNEASSEQVKVETGNELEAKVANMQKHISALNEENKNHRLRAKSEQEAKLAALSENGEFKALAEALTEKISGLEAGLPEMRAKADKFDEWTASEAQRIEAELEHIPEQWRVVIEHSGDLETKKRILDTLNIGKSHQQQPKPTNQASAPANNQSGITAKDLADQWLAKKQNKGGLFGR